MSQIDLISVGIAWVFVTIVVIKLVAIIQSIRWEFNCGRKFSDSLENYNYNSLQLSDENVFQLYNQHNADFFPFGFKDYKARRWAKGRKVRSLLRKVAFSYPYLIFVICAIILTIVTINWSFGEHSASTIFCLGLLCFVFFLMNLAMSIEFILGSLVMGNYVEFVHLLDDKVVFHKWRNNIPDAGLKALKGLTMLSALMAGVMLYGLGVIYFETIMSNSFTLNHCGQLDAVACFSAGGNNWPTSSMEAVVSSAYYVTTTVTTIGYGDMYPRDYWGQLTAISLHLQQVTILVVAFFVLSITLKPSATKL